ncbi:VIT1/CCC1 transporter family protein [Hoeflea sp. WL0058]|uniref:VIT1/CCC1 transporter family protein n=1 Tax=Flavimaribacter sediminis TaxID=2865987 RepID=A0AAE2ZTH3_9HYPH|nr:VIT1/CCC1 transporter family protein [Flavimaribacter sediminis]MBW8639287.1 VIT1/CCC1 transporter family protein [Flavimaribacter sediminis]
MKLEHDHSVAAIRARLSAGAKPNYIRDWVYGGIDGAVTTFAIISGVVGAELSTRTIIIMGFANLIADGFSMAASNYSGTKTEVDNLERLRRIERKHIAAEPEGEREEIRQILQGKGIEGEALESAVAAVTSNDETWISTMLVDEYGLSEVVRSPMLSAASTFIAFLICGLVPLMPYLIGSEDGFVISLVATAIVFFAIGATKATWSPQPWWRSGLETLAIGLAASAVAYAIGYFLKSVV